MRTNSYRRLLRFAVIAALTFASTVPGASGSLAQSSSERRFIVVLKDRLDARQVSQEHSKAYDARVSRVYSRSISGYAALLSESRVEQLRRDPRVAFVADDVAVQAAALVPVAAGDSVPAHVRRTEAATTNAVRQAANVAVAVLDTGIDLDHPDLNPASGTNCVNPGSLPDDDHGHGTHVAGTIAARNNGSGVVGVAPGTTVHPVKVLDGSGNGYLSGLICGLDWVAANAGARNIRVANLSLTAQLSNDNNCGNTNNDAFHTAICNLTAAGTTVVAAAGNQSTNFSGRSPANYPEVLAVTAMADSNGAAGGGGGSACGYTDDRYASFSNYAGSSQESEHTIAAPGVCVYSTHRNGGYQTISGTSMASAHASGSVALCIGDGGSAGPCAGKSPSFVIQQLRTEAASRTAGYGYVGDPRNSPVTGRYYGYLVWDGGGAGTATTPTSTTSTTSTSTTSTTTTPTTTTSTTVSTTTTTVASPGPTTTASTTTTVLASVAPSAPRNLSSTQPSSGPGVRLFWQAPTTGPVTAYEVWRRDSATPTYVRYATVTTLGFDDTVPGNTVAGRLYYYQVRALNGATAGPFSNFTRMIAR